MRYLVDLRKKLVLACVMVAVLAAVFAAAALADEVFTPRHTVEPYAEGNHSAEGLVDIIQGEGWQAESCVDIHLETGGYAAEHCNPAGVYEESQPHNNGYARVWNAKGVKNEIWGWARF
jgi:hypothetical protein